MKSLKTLIIAYWAKTLDATAIFLRFASRKFRALMIPIQRIFGFYVIPDPIKSRSIDLSAFLTETDQKIAELPKSYRELFDLSAAISSEMFINAGDNINQVQKAYDAWKDGFPSSIAIVGEKGSGKSTLIHMLKESVFTDIPITNIDFAQSTWKIEQILSSLGTAFEVSDVNRPETLINAINARDERFVVCLEGLQNLYLRNINGFEALEALWLIISETKEKVLWLTSCSRYAWEFLNKVEGIDAHFSHVCATDTLNDEQITNVIMKRHDKSVFKLRFEPDESTRKSRNYKKRLNNPKEIQAYLKEVYFEELTELTGGNASVAAISWLRSIKKIEGRTLVIAPFQPVNIDSLEILNSETLFVLAAIILHDTLKVAELCRVMNLNLSTSKVLLSRLKSRGFLLENQGAYYLNQLVYRQVLRLLKKRNIIH